MTTIWQVVVNMFYYNHFSSYDPGGLGQNFYNGSGSSGEAVSTVHPIRGTLAGNVLIVNHEQY